MGQAAEEHPLPHRSDHSGASRPARLRLFPHQLPAASSQPKGHRDSTKAAFPPCGFVANKYLVFVLFVLRGMRMCSAGNGPPHARTHTQRLGKAGGREAFTHTQNNPYLSPKTDPTVGFPGVTQLHEHVEKKCISPKHWTYM